MVVPMKAAVTRQQNRYSVSPYLLQVRPLQVAVLGLGDAMMAVTLTANNAAVRSAAHSGVKLEAVTHRAAWLMGK